ncbi:hypothetical protein V8F06_012384 [Rhypophila decipiens]
MSAPPDKQLGPGPSNPESKLTGDSATRASQRQTSILRSDAVTRDRVLQNKWPVVPPGAGGGYTALYSFLVLCQNLLRSVLRRGAKVDTIEKISESFSSEELVMWEEFCEQLGSRNWSWWSWEKLDTHANIIVDSDEPIRFVQLMDKPGQELISFFPRAGRNSWRLLHWNGVEDIGSTLQRVFSGTAMRVPGSDDLLLIRQRFPAVMTISYNSNDPVPDIWERARTFVTTNQYTEPPVSAQYHIMAVVRVHGPTGPPDLIRIYDDDSGTMVHPLGGEMSTQPWSLSDAGSELCLFYHRVPMDRPDTLATEQIARRSLPNFRASQATAQESTVGVPPRARPAPAPA